LCYNLNMAEINFPDSPELNDEFSANGRTWVYVGDGIWNTVETETVQGPPGPSAITTQGDLAVGDASGVPTRLPIGDDEQVLTVVDGEVAWADAAVGAGFNALEVITASNATYSIPSLGSSIIKVTVIGGGGGGGGTSGNGGNGGNSSVAGTGLSTVTALGGTGGALDGNTTSSSPTFSFASANNGTGNKADRGEHGNGGEIKQAYLNVAGLSTLDITIGSGGSGGSGGAGGDGKNGFRGEVILEYVSA
jgi:hypothetical protein